MLEELRCDCGYVARGEKDSFVAAVQAHALVQHNTQLTADTILALAEAQRPERTTC